MSAAEQNSAPDNAPGPDAASYSGWAARLRAERLAKAGIPQHVAALPALGAETGARADAVPAAPPPRRAGQQSLHELLAARCSRFDRLPKILTVIRDACKILSAAHARGIIHGNVRPTTILFDDTGVELACWEDAVADGEVQRHPAVGCEQASCTQAPLLLPPAARPDNAFRAPEQHRAQPLDARTDVYAVGALLCAALTGKLPPYAKLPETSIDQPLGRLAKRCLAEKPDRRPQTMNELISAIEDSLKALAGQSLGAPPPRGYDLDQTAEVMPVASPAFAAPQNATVRATTPAAVKIPAPFTGDTTASTPARNWWQRWSALLLLLTICGWAVLALGCLWFLLVFDF